MTHKGKILIVDDNVDNVDLLAKRFKALGYPISVAYDGQEALERVEEETPDLLILDVMMPKVDGMEVCRKLKSDPDTQAIPIIMLTAKREVNDKVKGLDIGADDYVTKPFNPHELVARVKSLLTRRLTQQKLVTEEKLGALGQMAEGVAHEVRNPMVTIGGFARRIHDKLPEDDPLREYAGHIMKEVERLETMVEEIVKFKTLMISPYGEVNLVELLAEVVESLSGKLDDFSITAKISAEGGIPEIQADRNNLRICFSNAMTNCIEAMEEGGGEVTIKVSHEGETVTVVFEDKGVGIPQSELPNVFDPFFTSKMSGAGVGLTMVHRVVTRHGGEVDIKSEVGVGTRLLMELPVRQKNSI